MTEQGLSGLPHPRRRIPNLIRLHTPSDLVNRHFTAAQPNELWCTDITEHPARDGKVYCCAILDCFSQMIVARTFSTTADTAGSTMPSTWLCATETATAQCGSPRIMQVSAMRLVGWWPRLSRRWLG